eukprot:835034-Amphidinium_carterae.1
MDQVVLMTISYAVGWKGLGWVRCSCCCPPFDRSHVKWAKNRLQAVAQAWAAHCIELDLATVPVHPHVDSTIGPNLSIAWKHVSWILHVCALLRVQSFCCRSCSYRYDNYTETSQPKATIARSRQKQCKPSYG